MRLAAATLFGVGVLFTLAGSAAPPTAQAIGYHNVHLRVADPAAASAWYIKFLGATKAPPPFSVQFGKTMVAFVRTDKPLPSEGSAIDHIGVSFADLKSKMKEFETGGVKIVTPMAEAPGMFAYGYIEDPWGVKIEVMQDSELVGFHHVHLRVADPAATLQWFTDNLGGKPAKLRGRLDGVRFGDIWLFAAKSTTPTEPSAARAIQNIAILFANVDEAYKALQSRGVKTISEPRVVQPVRYAFVEDPNGVRVELITTLSQ
jgi:catechol 2,3-dioxygenase-like lactoylglutathione lyase family enzyme